jgi:hypothetical protein
LLPFDATKAEDSQANSQANSQAATAANAGQQPIAANFALGRSQQRINSMQSIQPGTSFLPQPGTSPFLCFCFSKNMETSSNPKHFFFILFQLLLSTFVSKQSSGCLGYPIFKFTF